MNKLIISIATLIVAATFAQVFAQSNSDMQDVVHLHNGSVVRGTITEFVPDSIVKISSADIEFTFPMKEVDKITKGQRVTNATNETTDPIAPAPQYSRFRAAIGGGFSYRTAKVYDGAPSQYEDTKSGYGIDASVSYFVSPSIAVGLRYNQFISDTEDDMYGFKDKMRTTLIGPAIYYRIPNSKHSNQSLLIGGTLGYMKHSEKLHWMGEFGQMKGSTLGLGLDFAYDISWFGVQLSLIVGSLSEWDANYGYGWHTVSPDDSDSYEGLSRIELTFGFRFNR